ncbi:MAG: VIT1/CCC1 transporter family protein [Anaerolineales bacterium]
MASRLMQRGGGLSSAARGELGIDPEAPGSPQEEGLVTGISPALGAVIPMISFAFLQGPPAWWTAVALAMSAHFAVGASRAVFTGRPAVRRGADMFLVGMGVAAFTYLLGVLVGVHL